MQFSTVFAVFSGLLVSSVSAQTACDPAASAIPPCGVSCILSAATAVGCTDSTNYSCRCASASAIQNSAANCVIGGCGLATALQVLSSASALCNCVATATPAPAPLATGVVAVTTTA